MVGALVCAAAGATRRRAINGKIGNGRIGRIAFALNHVGDSLAELEEAQEYLSQKPYHVLAGYLPQKVSYSRAMDVGLSVIEVSHKGLRAQAEQLISAIIQRATALQSK